MDDPGWRGSWRGVRFIIWPLLGARRIASSGRPPVTVFRQRFVGFVASDLLILSVGLQLSHEEQHGDLLAAAFSGFIVAWAAYSLVVERVVAKRVDWKSATGDRARLLEVYRQSFFVRMALANSVLLLGWVFVFITGRHWLLGVGAMAASPLLVLFAPTGTSIRKIDDEARSAGATGSLRAALLSQPA